MRNQLFSLHFSFSSMSRRRVLPGSASCIHHSVCGDSFAGYISIPAVAKHLGNLVCLWLVTHWSESGFSSGSEVTLGEGRFSSGHDGICRAWLEKPRNELGLGAVALRMCIFCEYNTDKNTNLKNSNPWAINSLLYPRQLLVFHIYLWFITIWIFIDLLL